MLCTFMSFPQFLLQISLFILFCRYHINVTAQNHISSVSSTPFQLNLIQKVANLTSIFCQGPNLVNHSITYRAFYWFGTNLTFQWDFGDGSSLVYSTTSSVQHIYKEYDSFLMNPVFCLCAL